MGDAVKRAVGSAGTGTDELNMMFYRGIAPAPQAGQDALVEDVSELLKDLDTK